MTQFNKNNELFLLNLHILTKRYVVIKKFGQILKTHEMNDHNHLNQRE